MSKHTLGPWKVRKHWSDSGCYEVYPTRGKSPRIGQWAAIAEIVDGASKGESVRANALLIAAAPDLLTALQALLSDVGDANSMLGARMARAAIAKATGQPAGEGEK